MKNLWTAEDLQARAWPEAAALVAHEEQRSGSRMAAYRDVARMIGWSRSKLQKLLGRQPFSLEAHEFVNLSAAYERLCERIEARADQERLRAARAKERTHAALASAHLSHSRDVGAHQGRAR